MNKTSFMATCLLISVYNLFTNLITVFAAVTYLITILHRQISIVVSRLMCKIIFPSYSLLIQISILLTMVFVIVTGT